MNLRNRRQLQRIKAWDLHITDTDYLQPGYSGSPVIEFQSGAVIGVVTTRQGEGRRGLAISIESLQSIWKDFASIPLYKPLSPLIEAYNLDNIGEEVSYYIDKIFELRVFITSYEVQLQTLFDSFLENVKWRLEDDGKIVEDAERWATEIQQGNQTVIEKMQSLYKRLGIITAPFTKQSEQLGKDVDELRLTYQKMLNDWLIMGKAKIRTDRAKYFAQCFEDLLAEVSQKTTIFTETIEDVHEQLKMIAIPFPFAL